MSILRLIILIASLLGTPYIDLNNVSIYPLTAECIEVNTIKNQAYFEDYNKNIWSYDAYDWEKGDIASLIMFDNGTIEIEDDVIVCARYGGSQFFSAD